MIANYNSGMITTKRNHHFLLLLLLLIAPCASSLTFDFPPFQQIDHTNSSARLLLTEGDAVIANQFLYLNVNGSGTESVCRATYGKPFLLKENGTGKLVDFKTSFAFVIDGKNSTAAEGLAFFLAPNGSLLNKALGVGSSLGLPVNSSVGNVIEPSNEYPFVAVEFDVHRNRWPTVEDPEGDHVGIDVNCVKSNITRPWNGGIMEAKVNRAWISYNSSSKNLSVAYTSYVPGTQEQVISHLSYMVDLNKYFRDWVIVGFSASSAGEYPARSKIISWSFTSTSLVDDESLSLSGGEKTQESPVTATSKRKKPLVVVISSTVGGGGFIIVCLVGLGLFNSCKKRPTGEGTDKNLRIPRDLIDEFEISRPMKFSYSQLASSTTQFADREKLGVGAFGVVFRGYIKELNSYVAIKKISSEQGLKEGLSELRTMSRLRHRNLMELIGWCDEKGQLLLVYEFMPNGRLDSHLFEDKSSLAWEARYKIVQGLASGLLYLHQELDQCVLHRDIKSSSVMLDSNSNPKVGNFGLARTVDHEEEMETAVAGTIGYIAPEYFITGKASKKSDVYSFGVVTLEIACGRKPWDFLAGNSQITMVEWVWELYGQGKVLEAADPKLCGDFDEKQMECLLIVGLWCAHPDYNSRPPIQRAILALNFELQLPILPSKMPTTFSPAMSLSRASSTYSEAGQIESDSTVVTPIPILLQCHSQGQIESTGSSATNSHSSISFG